VFFGRLRGRRKRREKSRTQGEGIVGAVVGFLSLCFPSSPVSFSLSFFFVSSPFYLLSFLTSHSGYLRFKLPSPFSFKRALSLVPKIPPAAGVESSIYRLEGCGLLLRVGSRGVACCCAWEQSTRRLVGQTGGVGL